MSNTTISLTKADLTRAQLAFYNSSTAGVKATIIRNLRSNNGNTDSFKSWFRKYKNSNS